MDVSGASASLTWAGNYEDVIVFLNNIVPVNADDQLEMRFSSDGGSNFNNGPSDYESGVNFWDVGTQIDAGAALNRMYVAGDSLGGRGVGNQANRGVTGTLVIARPSDASHWTRYYSFGSQAANAGGDPAFYWCGGARLATAKVDAFQLFWNSGGNFSSGSFDVYGVRPVERAA